MFRKQRFQSGSVMSTDAHALAIQNARHLIKEEQERSGAPINKAIKNVAGRLRKSPTKLWALLFRPPKVVCGDLFLALEAAVDRSIERQIRELEHELAVRRARAGKARRADPAALAEVDEGIARLKAVLRGEPRT